MTSHEFIDAVLHSPIVVAYLAGAVTGWSFARRATRYMLGGRLVIAAALLLAWSHPSQADPRDVAPLPNPHDFVCESVAPSDPRFAYGYQTCRMPALPAPRRPTMQQLGWPS